MKNKLKRGVSAIMAGACMVMSLPCTNCLLSSTVTNASYLENQVEHLSGSGLADMGNIDGYAYYLYNDAEQGKVKFEADDDGYNFKWDSVDNGNFYIGKEYSYGITKDRMNTFEFRYKAKLNFEEGDSFGLFFDMEKPNAECCIVDGWGSYRPWSTAESLGEFTSNGVTYDIYKTKRVTDADDKSSVKAIDQYWSVARASFSHTDFTSTVESFVDIKAHLDAWEKAGLKVGAVKDIYFNVNSHDSTGDAVLCNFYLDDDFKYDFEDENRCAYPEAWQNEQNSELIKGYSNGFDYFIENDRTTENDGVYKYTNTDENGFLTSWQEQENFNIYKGKRYKKPVSLNNIGEISLNYDMSVNSVEGDKFEYGVACETNFGDDKIYIVEGYGDYDITEDLRELYEYTVDGVVYHLYNKWTHESDDRSFWCIPEKKICDPYADKDCTRTINVKPHIEAIKETGYWVPDVSGCYFYINSENTDADVEVRSLELNDEIKSDLMGLNKYIDVNDVDEYEDEELKGDLNGDLRVDAFDFILYRRMLLGNGGRKMCPRYADIDDDGELLINDLVLMKKYILGKSKKLGIPDKLDSGETDNYYYKSKIEKSQGKIIKDVKDDGSFNCAFKEVKNADFECGSKMNPTISLNYRYGVFSIYDVDIEVDNDYVFGIHGEFDDNDNEFYIIEAGRDDKLLSKAESLGSFCSNGYTYDAYRIPKGKPLANGNYMCYEYWSVLRNYSVNNYAKMRMSGNINILDHVEAFEKLGDCSLSGLAMERAGIYFKCKNSMLSSINVKDNRVIEK